MTTITVPTIAAIESIPAAVRGNPRTKATVEAMMMLRLDLADIVKRHRATVEDIKASKPAGGEPFIINATRATGDPRNTAALDWQLREISEKAQTLNHYAAELELYVGKLATEPIVISEAPSKGQAPAVDRQRQAPAPAAAVNANATQIQRVAGSALPSMRNDGPADLSATPTFTANSTTNQEAREKLARAFLQHNKVGVRNLTALVKAPLAAWDTIISGFTNWRKNGEPIKLLSEVQSSENDNANSADAERRRAIAAAITAR